MGLTAFWGFVENLWKLVPDCYIIPKSDQIGPQTALTCCYLLLITYFPENTQKVANLLAPA